MGACSPHSIEEQLARGNSQLKEGFKLRLMEADDWDKGLVDVYSNLSEVGKVT
jgi:hypothetical protein